MAERPLATKAKAAAKKAATPAKAATKKASPTARAPAPAPRRLEWMPVSELPEDSRNAKNHAEGDLDASLGRFGYTTPCEIDERTGLLVAGHGRKAALQRRILAGDPPPDGIQVDPKGRWLVPVVRGWASADDNEAAAYLAANNQLTIAGGFDDEALARLLEEAAATELGLAGTAYTDQELDGLRLLADDEAWDEHGPWDGYGGDDSLSKSPRLQAERAKAEGTAKDPDPTALWPRIELAVPTEVFEAWRRLLAGHEGPTEVAKLTAHLRHLGHLG